MLYTTPKKKPVKQTLGPQLCWVSRKDDPKGLEYQAIKRRDGSILVGIDIWRLLDKADFPSYEYECFNDERELKRKYYFRKIRKSYFMENMNPDEGRYSNGLL